MANESFRWNYCHFDITAILDAIAQGALQPSLIELCHDFIATYCQLFLDPKSSHSRPPIAASAAYAKTIARERLLSPILLIHVGTGDGLVSLSETEQEPDYVVGDGNHRLLAAMQRGEVLKAFVLSEADSTLYRTEFEH